LKSIRSIQFPLETYDDPVVSELVWSDPSQDNSFFEFSVRGIGWLFGAMAVKEFLQEIGMKLLVRAHQCVSHGVSISAHKCVTVFSSSNYNKCENSAGFVTLTSNGEIEERRLPPRSFVHRTAARFVHAGLKLPRIKAMPLHFSGTVLTPWASCNRRGSDPVIIIPRKLKSASLQQMATNA
jgi:hypothetical protein